MALKQRIISEIYNDQTGEILNKEIIEDKVIEPPKQIEDLGYDHQQQMMLLQHIQDSFLSAQSTIYNLPDKCGSCGCEMRNYGSHVSKFNSVFSDHKISLSKRRCCNQDCRKVIVTTVQGLFGDHRHPDLVEMQTLLSSKDSFVGAQKTLEIKNKKHRPVNGQLNIKRFIERVGEALHDIHQDNDSLDNFNIINASELIVQADGGHIKDKHPNRASFEALLTKVYSPEDLIYHTSKSGKVTGEIISKSYAASSYKDHHKTMKKMTLLAALKQGLTKETNITTLADGAKNCWSILKSLKPHCKSITYILDWYHIRKKFDTLIGQLDSENSEELESIKWKIWHGKSDDALLRLTALYSALITTLFADKAHDLLKYIANNKGYLVNYEERKNQKKVFTSSVIESSIETVINERFKKKQKALWTRETSHKILQVRTSTASNQWSIDWKLVKQKIYKIAA
jgi:hypothetical protein